jgi:hypothetical protein
VLLPVSATAVPVVVAFAFWSFVFVGGGVVVSLAGVSIVAGASVAGGSLGAGSAGAGSLAAGVSVAGGVSAGASDAGGLGGVDSATESGVEGAGSSAYARPPRTTTEERHTADPTNSRMR